MPMVGVHRANPASPVRPKEGMEALRSEAERWKGRAEVEEAHAAELVADQLRLQVGGDPEAARCTAVLGALRS